MDVTLRVLHCELSENTLNCLRVVTDIKIYNRHLICYQYACNVRFRNLFKSTRLFSFKPKSNRIFRNWYSKVF